MWKISNLEINNPIVMAPMAGISNPAYIKIIEEMGCGLAFTELISSEAIIRNNKKTFDMLNGIENIKMPVGIQLFGSDPDNMAKAAKIVVEKYKARLIDINMGCPVPKVALRAEAGSALLKNPNKVYEIVSKVVENVNVPVTVKIRSGWDNNNINAIEIAKIIEKAGAKAISIHARTRSQGYTGKADWNIIKKVKENVSIPVIGNGDVRSVEDAKRMLEETKCDAVMIGRGLLGNPWLVKNCVLYLEDKEIIKPTKNDIVKMIKKHLDYLLKYRNEKTVVLEIRSHVSWYFKGMKNSSIIKNKICKCNSIHDILLVLDEYLETEE